MHHLEIDRLTASYDGKHRWTVRFQLNGWNSTP